MRIVLVIALLATGCAMEPTGQEQLWTVTVESEQPSDKPCERPAGGLDLHVVKDLDGVYRPDPAWHELDQISLWQEDRPEYHSIDLDIDLWDRDGDVETRWSLIVNWTTEHQRVFRGAASLWKTSISTGLELCDSPYTVNGYVYLL